MNKNFIALLFIITIITTNTATANSALTPLNNPITQGINHLGLTVSNLEQSTQFFTETLGWKVVGGYDDYPSKFVTDGKLFLTLWQVTNPSKNIAFDRKNNVGLHHLALSIASLEDLNILYERCKKTDGVIIEFPPEPNGDGPTIHMMIAEPSGNRIEFAYTPK
ncbi:VOC family protein [Colwellia demingiae]|uniref:VOC family protein n=1 Tax=Colwellia demingiae TaxID=89401 RepID=A0A5C6QSI3_9GAMM|nr:VOC family protein [Colwellia demingiae]TWX72075.1 VOC family protein [Colwellia demingiae]